MEWRIACGNLVAAGNSTTKPTKATFMTYTCLSCAGGIVGTANYGDAVVNMTAGFVKCY